MIDEKKEEQIETKLAVVPPGSVELSNEDLRVIRNAILPTATGPEMAMIQRMCGHYGLDPFRKEVHFWKDKHGKLNMQIGVDAYYRNMRAHPQFEECIGPEFCGDDGKWTDLWLKKAHPVAARFGIKRKDGKVPEFGIAIWDECVNNNPNWNTRKTTMIGKAAVGISCRRNLPDMFSGVYIEGEVNVVDGVAQDEGPVDAEFTEVDMVSEAETKEIQTLRDNLKVDDGRWEHLLQVECGGDVLRGLQKLRQMAVATGVQVTTNTEPDGFDNYLTTEEPNEDPKTGG